MAAESVGEKDAILEAHVFVSCSSFFFDLILAIQSCSSAIIPAHYAGIVLSRGDSCRTMHSDSGRSRLFGNAIQVLKYSRIELVLGDRPYLQGRCLVLLVRLVLMVRPECMHAHVREADLYRSSRSAFSCALHPPIGNRTHVLRL